LITSKTLITPGGCLLTMDTPLSGGHVEGNSAV